DLEERLAVGAVAGAGVHHAARGRQGEPDGGGEENGAEHEGTNAIGGVHGSLLSASQGHCGAQTFPLQASAQCAVRANAPTSVGCPLTTCSKVDAGVMICGSSEPSAPTATNDAS